MASKIEQHEENVEKEQWQKSALAPHKKNCDGDILFDEVKTLKMEHNTFNRQRNFGNSISPMWTQMWRYQSGYQ